MKLILFKISSDGDYGALSFEQSGETLEECYEQMVAENVEVIQGEDEDWEVSLEQIIDVRDQAEADAIVGGINAVLSEDWCGDYDNLKSTSWGHLIVK